MGILPCIGPELTGSKVPPAVLDAQTSRSFFGHPSPSIMDISELPYGKTNCHGWQNSVIFFTLSGSGWLAALSIIWNKLMHIIHGNGSPVFVGIGGNSSDEDSMLALGTQVTIVGLT